ncbi:hypothetical protein U3A58_12910 [Algoriphagus sp. C2-6-M1]|uniref:hypothetical protein n=1 Tax=Algoriphagus persicinus TaxID=3108754 RepID=UPI002B39A91C|nr:hypothetical protein [Algoriphagus sp. C2-6-M1]MEB2781294.1 hypothetical protein [Algoriphagus sp. C2-6-M1]
MTKEIFITIYLLTNCVSLMAQSKLYLQHQEKPSRNQKIKQKSRYNIITTDTVFYGYHLLKIQNDELTIFGNESGSEEVLHISEIQTLVKNINPGFFGFIGYLGVIMLSGTPVIWAFEGNEAALGMLEAAGGLMAISAPFIIVGEIGRKKDLKSKWKICTH